MAFRSLGGSPGAVLDLSDDDSTAVVAVSSPTPHVNWDTFKMQYHGCWPHSDDPFRKSPEDMPKEEFGELLLRLGEQCFRKSAESRRSRLNKISQASVFQELHMSGKPHYHFPILADHAWSFEPLKRALRDERIFVDFSTEHDYYWTTFIYLCVPGSSPGDKKAEDLDSSPWLSPGHLSVKETLQNIPRGARAADKVRVRRFLALEAPAEPKSQKDVSLTDKEFAKHVVAKKLLDVTAVQSHVAGVVAALKNDARAVPKDEALVVYGMEAYMYKHQASALAVPNILKTGEVLVSFWGDVEQRCSNISSLLN